MRHGAVVTGATRTRNVAAGLARLADRRGWAARPAFHTGDRTWSHGEVHDLAARVATRLRERGVRPGERILLALPDGIAFVATFLAAARIGAVAVTVNPALPAADHARLVADCAPVLAVTGPELAGRFDRPAWIGGSELLGRATTAPAAPALPVDARTPLYVQYTSGTTGTPKGAVHCHGDLPFYHHGAGELILRAGPGDVSLSVSRLHFAYGLGNSLIYPLHSGGAAVLSAERPGPEQTLELARRHRVTLLYAVPSAYAHLAAAGPWGLALRACVCAGEALSPALAARIAEAARTPVLDGLGSTELGGFCCLNRLERQAFGSVGWAVPGHTLQVRDDAGEPVPDGTTGLLWVRSPALMLGYLGRPAETARTVAGGWLATRDRAVLRPDGSVALAGRADDLEMVGGITVSAVEVEQVLAEHPGVADVAVAALPDECGATRLWAFVVPVRPGTPPEPLAAELIALARARLAPFKVPRTVRLVDSLPRTATGKLRRFVLRQGRPEHAR